MYGTVATYEIVWDSTVRDCFRTRTDIRTHGHMDATLLVITPEQTKFVTVLYTQECGVFYFFYTRTTVS